MKFYDILLSNMYNMDEKGFMVGVVSRCKVICKKGRRTTNLVRDGSREWVTVIEYVSGDGSSLRPMIMNKGQAHYRGWYSKLNKKDLAIFRVSEKGWSNEELRLRWQKEVFDCETWER